MDLLDFLGRITSEKDTKMDFVESKLFEASTSNVSISQDSTNVESTVSKGIFIRVLHNSFEGFASTENLSEMGVLRALEFATKMVEAGYVFSPQKLESSVAKGAHACNAVNNEMPSDIDHVAKVRELRREYNNVCGHFSEGENIKMYFSQVNQNQYYSNSLGKQYHISQTLIGTYYDVTRNSLRLFEGRNRVVSGEMSSESFSENVGSFLARRFRELSISTSSPSGQMSVITSPEVSGTLAHELGHIFEADSGKVEYLRNHLDRQICSPEISLIDEGNNSNFGGYCPVDDEGVDCKKALLIDSGYLSDFLTNRCTAEQFGLPCTGNARTDCHLRKPVVRMRQTYFEGGSDCLEDMISECQSGILVEKAAGGQNGPDGRLVLRCMLGRTIESGKLGKPVQNFNLSGNPLELLSAIQGLTKNKVLFNDKCGKDQIITIAHGGPFVKLRAEVQG
ncbi:MAG: TldD/PmbA family protein [Thaumarchaeota archaeon]|nr:TldD/PmbA family protein [Nitrososphaerota archaeon]